MKKAIPAALLSLALLAGCANKQSETSEITYSHEKDGYTLSFSLPYSPCDKTEGYYDLDLNDHNVTYSD